MSVFRNAVFLKRRSLLRLAIGGTAILACGAMSGCQSPKKGEEGMKARSNDFRMGWLEAAIRAPSSHNMQPWRVDLHSRTDGILLFMDGKRLLPEADTHNRQAMVSLGGFIEQLAIAASGDGYRCEAMLFPQGEGEGHPVAELIFNKVEPQLLPDGLLPFVGLRYVNRDIFTEKGNISPAHLALLTHEGRCLGVTSDGCIEPGKVMDISATAVQAWKTELQQAGIVQELLRLTRIGRDEIKRHRDGIAVQGLLPELAALLGLFPRDRMPEADSMVMKNMHDMGVNQARSAKGWIWVVSPDNSRTAQIAAGRAFVRLHLRAIQLGIGLQPMSQALEDYPEMVPHYQKLYRQLGVRPGEKVQMLARIGYADSSPTTLRRPLADIVL